MAGEKIEQFKALWKSCSRTERDQIKALIDGTNTKTAATLKSEAVEVIEFLNMKTGRRYRPVGANLDMVKARLKSGVTVQEMKAVVAKKCRDWNSDDKMETYLRPKTLFGRENFENYLGEIGKIE